MPNPHLPSTVLSVLDKETVESRQVMSYVVNNTGLSTLFSLSSCLLVDLTFPATRQNYKLVVLRGFYNFSLKLPSHLWWNASGQGTNYWQRQHSLWYVAGFGGRRSRLESQCYDELLYVFALSKSKFSDLWNGANKIFSLGQRSARIAHGCHVSKELGGAGVLLKPITPDLPRKASPRRAIWCICEEHRGAGAEISHQAGIGVGVQGTRRSLS